MGPPAWKRHLEQIAARLAAPPTQNPSHRPSGEKNGLCPPSVPPMGVASKSVSGRTYNCCWPPRTALNTRNCPSGETAIAVRPGRPSPSCLIHRERSQLFGRRHAHERADCARNVSGSSRRRAPEQAPSRPHRSRGQPPAQVIQPRVRAIFGDVRHTRGRRQRARQSMSAHGRRRPRFATARRDLSPSTCADHMVDRRRASAAARLTAARG